MGRNRGGAASSLFGLTVFSSVSLAAALLSRLGCAEIARPGFHCGMPMPIIVTARSRAPARPLVDGGGVHTAGVSDVHLINRPRAFGADPTLRFAVSNSCATITLDAFGTSFVLVRPTEGTGSKERRNFPPMEAMSFCIARRTLGSVPRRLRWFVGSFLDLAGEARSPRCWTCLSKQSEKATTFGSCSGVVVWWKASAELHEECCSLSLSCILSFLEGDAVKTLAPTGFLSEQAFVPRESSMGRMTRFS